jgi:hypothetical protein
MPIALPDFKNPHFFWMTLCAEAPNAGPDLVKWMRGEKDTIAIYKVDRGDAYLRLMLGGGKNGRHVHLDVFSPELSTKKNKTSPESQSDQLVELTEMDKSISRLLGEEIEVHLRAGYKAQIEELPETGIIRAFSFDTTVGNVSLKLDGAMFAIKGAPIQGITWNVLHDGDIAVTLEADGLKIILAEDYLLTANKIAEEAFNIFVLGKAINEPK